MSTAVSGVKPRAPKPWDKLRRHVRSGSLGAVSQPSSPGSPEVEPGPFHLRDGNLQERNIANAGGPVPSARHSEPAKGAGALAELAAQAAPAQAGAASTPPSRVYARSKSAPGSSSAPSDDKAEKTRTFVSPGSASRSPSTALERGASSAPTRQTRDALEAARIADERKNAARPDDASFDASSSGADTRPEQGSVEFPDVGEGPDAFQWLLTRQLEVEMSLRGAPPATQADVEATRATFASFCVFFDDLRRGAAALSAHADASFAGGKSTSPGSKDSRVRGFLVPPEDARGKRPACEPFSLFQELLHRVAGFTAGGSSVDEQRRDGDVPMHQAKVLYRASVATDAVLREVDAVLGEETVRELAATVRKMRAMLRVKMEDANDVRMAEEAVRGARRFFDTLKIHAEKEGKEDVEVLRTLREA